MDFLPADLLRTASEARGRLVTLARQAAAADAAGGSGAAPAMARAARTALFTDALLAAMHARLTELKNVVK